MSNYFRTSGFQFAKMFNEINVYQSQQSVYFPIFFNHTLKIQLWFIIHHLPQKWGIEFQKIRKCWISLWDHILHLLFLRRHFWSTLKLLTVMWNYVTLFWSTNAKTLELDIQCISSELYIWDGHRVSKKWYDKDFYGYCTKQ